MSRGARAALLGAAVAACAVAAYAPSFNNGFIWDDPIVLEQQMVAFRSLKDAFLPPKNIPQFGVFYYRPIVVVSYMIDTWFAGAKPIAMPRGSINPFHVSGVIYHAIVTAFVFLLGRLLLRRKPWGEWAALAGGLLFAVHPIHTESVCWMAGRSDVLASLGLVPALILYLAGRARGSRVLFVAAAVPYLFGLLAKETAIAVLLALPLLDLVPLEEAGAVAGPAKATPRAGRGGKGSKGREISRAAAVRSVGAVPVLWRYVPFAVATVLYWWMRRADLGRDVRGSGLGTLLFSADVQAQRDRLAQVLLDVVGAAGFYIRKVFVPLNLNAFVAEVPSDGLTRALGVAGILGSIAIGFWAYRRGVRVALALGALFFATLAPSFAIAILQISEAPVAERYLYIPSIAVCLGVPYMAGILVERMRERRGARAARAALAVALAAGGLVFAVFCYATGLRNETWSGDRVFWEDAVAKAPHQGLPHLHLGLTYDREDAKDEAEQKKLNEMAKKEYLTALDEKNVVYDIEGRSTAWNNIANVYMAEGDDAKAQEAFLKAIEMRPDYPTPHYGLGLLHYHKGVAAQRAGDGPGAVRNMQVAREWLEKAIRLNERYVKAIFLNGVVLMSLRDPQASRSLSEVIRLIPGTSEAARAQELLDLMRAHPEDYSRGATVASVPGASEGNPRVVGGAAPKQPPGGGPRR